MYYAKANGLAVVDSFKEGNYGSATGKLAGGLNNNTSGVIDADFGNNIQQYINLLEYIKGEMSEVVGITKQERVKHLYQKLHMELKEQQYSLIILQSGCLFNMM